MRVCGFLYTPFVNHRHGSLHFTLNNDNAFHVETFFQQQ